MLPRAALGGWVLAVLRATKASQVSMPAGAWRFSAGTS